MSIIYDNYCYLMYNFDNNFNELQNLLENRTEDDIIKNFNFKNLIKYRQEELRLIFNFLSAANTLKEFVRESKNKWGFTKAFLEEYDNRVENTFKKSPLVQFVEACRNMLVHEGFPFPKMSRIHFNKNSPITYSLTVKSEDLIKSEFFKKGVAYCNTHEEINFSEVCSEYYKIVKDFYAWFDSNMKFNSGS